MDPVLPPEPYCPRYGVGLLFLREDAVNGLELAQYYWRAILDGMG